jgi:hypothetical protein
MSWVIEGTDLFLKKRVLLISGHYDHIGLAKRVLMDS